MKSRTAKNRNPVATAGGPPERRASRRAATAPRDGNTFYRPKFKVSTADFLDAHSIPGYN